MSVPLLGGFGEVAAAYDGFILDLWGVLHDGSHPYPGVLDTLDRLKQAGKRLVVLSNAPRRAAPVAQRMAEIGVPPELFVGIHSSGEEVWQNLERRQDPFYAALGRRCFFIGPERDESLSEAGRVSRVANVAEAEFLLNTGPWGWDESTDGYESVLAEAQARGLPMVCANADLVVVHKGRRVICAGALAERYEALGGTVRWHGKPYPSVYDTCLTMLGISERGRILAVGDSLRTDIAGARRAGIASVWVAGGIHGEELGVKPGAKPDAARIAAALAASGEKPLGTIGGFTW